MRVAPLDENTRWRAGDVLGCQGALLQRSFRKDVGAAKSGDAAVDFVLADGEGPSVVEAEIVDDPSGVGALAKFRATESGKHTPASSPPTSRDSGGAGCSASAFRARPSSSSSRRPPRTRLGRACNSAVYASEVEACCSDWPEDRWRSSSLRAIDSTTKPSLTKNGCVTGRRRHEFVFALSSKEAGEVMFTNALQRAGTYSLQ